MTVTFYLTTGGVNYGFMVEVLAGFAVANRPVWLVLQPGEQFGAVATVANRAFITAHGTELEGVAD